MGDRIFLKKNAITQNENVIYICADHMAHYRMGVCEAPNTAGENQYLCQYCRTPAHDIIHPKDKEYEPIFCNEPKDDAIFPSIKMERRVPDLLHMSKM